MESSLSLKNRMLVSKEDLQIETTQLARKLIGCYLSHQSSDGLTIGRIVETEAYLSEGDPGCHAHLGKTKRNAPMFGPPGKSYVYLIYGMYHCFNVTSAGLGKGEAVLVRALEPIEGLALMKKRRNTNNLMALCSGPGKLSIAMGIGLQHNSLCLRNSSLLLHSRGSFNDIRQENRRINIDVSKRIGLSKGGDLPLRFLECESKYVSRTA